MDELKLPLSQVRRLLSAGSGGAALLYLYLQSGGPLPSASGALGLPQEQVDAALMKRERRISAPSRPATPRPTSSAPPNARAASPSWLGKPNAGSDGSSPPRS